MLDRRSFNKVTFQVPNFKRKKTFTENISLLNYSCEKHTLKNTVTTKFRKRGAFLEEKLMSHKTSTL